MIGSVVHTLTLSATCVTQVFSCWLHLLQSSLFTRTRVYDYEPRGLGDGMSEIDKNTVTKTLHVCVWVIYERRRGEMKLIYILRKETRFTHSSHEEGNNRFTYWLHHFPSFSLSCFFFSFFLRYFFLDCLFLFFSLLTGVHSGRYNPLQMNKHITFALLHSYSSRLRKNPQEIASVKMERERRKKPWLEAGILYVEPVSQDQIIQS